MIGRTFLFWMCVLWTSCSPSSVDDLRYEGRAETRKLSKELRSIETREELQRRIPRIKQRFQRLAKILLEVKNFPKIEEEPSFESEELFIELARIYEISGGRELIESAQSDAVEILKNL